MVEPGFVVFCIVKSLVKQCLLYKAMVKSLAGRLQTSRILPSALRRPSSQEMQGRFQTMSDSIINRSSEKGPCWGGAVGPGAVGANQTVLSVLLRLVAGVFLLVLPSDRT